MNGKEDGRIIFSIRGSGEQDTSEVASASEGTYLNDEQNNCEDVKMLCIAYKNGKLGGACYNFQEKTLSVYEEMLDSEPQYFLTTTLIAEVNPKYVLSFGNITENYIKTLVDIISPSDTTNTTSTSNSLRNLPQNFFLLHHKDYTYEICKTIVINIDIASYDHHDDDSEVKRELYLNSLVNFDQRLSIQALGALYKYLEKNWAFFGVDYGSIQVLDIIQVTMKDRLLMDDNCFKALHIFSKRSHDAGFKRGSQSSSREGLSVFKLFSAECKSKLGLASLRKMLNNPINNKNELNKRLDFIGFVLEPANKDFIESLQDNIKQLRDVNSILTKIQNAMAKNQDWHYLYKTIYHTIFINEIGGPFRDKCTLLSELSEVVTIDLLGLETSISSALDFSTGNKRGRPVIKFGLDESLDAKLLRQQDISKHVTAAARFAVNDLPDFITECKVVYLPEMGHLVAIKEWEPDCDPDQLQSIGFQFMFTLRGTIHYKSPLCVELDRRLGDINAEIIDHENRILRRLSGFTLKYNRDIRKPLNIISLIDSLISMANVAMIHNFVRPQLNENSIHEIEDSRHPLMEQILTNFEPNSYYSGNGYSHVKIITGPNGSGKSIYLKQIALNIYFAHVGSFLPAKRANVGLLNTLHCRIQATESASVRLSAFMIDITQTTQALNNAAQQSLILMDEFGRGTLDDNGIALLAGVLRNYIDKKEQCPHILLSTHFQQLENFIPETPLVEYQKMDYIKENEELCFLYKLNHGKSASFALEIASGLLDNDIVSRAKTFFNCLKNNEPFTPLPMAQRKKTECNNNNFLQIPVCDEEEPEDLSPLSI